MEEFYVEYYFQTNDAANEYIFPLFIQAKNQQGARLISHQIQKELNEKFIIISVEPPRLNYNKFLKDHYNNVYRLHLDRNKLVNLQINSFEFNEFEANMSLTFDENLEKILAVKQTPGNIAKLISSKKYPVRVIKDSNKILHEYEDYLLINLHGIQSI